MVNKGSQLTAPLCFNENGIYITLSIYHHILPGSAVFCQSAAPAIVSPEPSHSSGTAASVTIEPSWVAIMAVFAVGICGVALLSNW